MFTGIIECLGEVVSLEQQKTNFLIEIKSPISKELKIDQSVCHNGVCLTIVKKNDQSHYVETIDETLKKTNLRQLQIGDSVNLERSLLANSRFDGHMVQGHVDRTLTILDRMDVNGSYLFKFNSNTELRKLIISKGSVCINGVSLTVIDSTDHFFSVGIIPYTFENTTFKILKIGDEVNLEIDILGKYIVNWLEISQLKS